MWLLCIIGYLFLGGGFAVDEHEYPLKFTLGLLAPWNASYEEFSALTSASAVSIAIDHIKEQPSLASKMEFTVITEDSACSSKTAAGNAIKMYMEDKVDVFIGPGCSEAAKTVAELASFWNVPMVSWVATDIMFNDKDYFTTMGRTLGPFDKLGSFLLEVFLQYDWYNVAVLSSNYGMFKDASIGIRKVFKDNNITIAYNAEYDRFPPDKYIEEQLTFTQEFARIVLVIAPKEDRRRFILQAHDLGMTKGEYVFYTIEMLPESDIITTDDVWMGNDGRDQAAREAFESVFHVTLAALSNARVNVFREEVARRMLEPPWNKYISKYTDMTDFVMGDKYAPFLHDTVLLVAIAINETLAKGEDPRDGFVVQRNMKGKVFTDFEMGDKYSPFLHDTVLLLAIAINETLDKGQDPYDGFALQRSMKGKVFNGMTGKLVLDDNGDREPDYWITDMAVNGTFIKIAEVRNLDLGERIFSKDLVAPRWPGGLRGHKYAPPDIPVCGFYGEHCPRAGIPTWVIAVTVVVACLFVSGISGLIVFLYRRHKFESELLIQSWRIKWEDMEPISNKGLTSASTFSKSGSDLGGGKSTPSLASSAHSEAMKIVAHKLGSKDLSSGSRSMKSVGTTATGGGQVFTDIAYYKGMVVSIKRLNKEHLQLTRPVCLEFNAMKDICHENLNIFVGSCVDPPNICVFWNYCPKGSIQDILLNDEVKLDQMFKLSFMYDIAKGMEYLHKSAIHSHGCLKSSNCLVDPRWAIKIGDYGLTVVCSGQQNQDNEADQWKKKLWTAPEILRENFPPPKGTQRGDVYSAGIIFYEIMMRTEPFTFETMTPRDAVNRIRNGESIPFRPHLPESNEMGRVIIDLIKSCWDENSDGRPNFTNIRILIRKQTSGEINIMDNVMNMMEKYAYNLQEIVDERTGQLVEEQRKTDRLLYRMLPSTVADQLKLGKFVKPENYDNSTIYFSDIVGFTSIASDSNPLQIVDFLNDLYTCFDDIIAKHDVYKVETIGDAYMVVSGVPIRNGARHAIEIANVSLDLLSAVTHFKIRHRPNQQLQLRIGLHSGAVVAGVVGLIMPRYCLFGDTVNMCARMESTGKPLRIHVSKPVFHTLKDCGGGYKLAKRGEINFQGKGLQTTYWLYGKKNYDKPLPGFDVGEMSKEDTQQEQGDDGTKSALMRSYENNEEKEPSMPSVV